jgi:hypothetical protein
LTTPQSGQVLQQKTDREERHLAGADTVTAMSLVCAGTIRPRIDASVHL